MASTRLGPSWPKPAAMPSPRLQRLLRACHVQLGRRPAMNLARIDLVALRLVVLCAEAGSLSAAARLAHLSLSGASHKLGSLEEALGTRLFDRHPRGLHPTRAGELVATHGRLMLGTLEHLAEKLAADPLGVQP